MQSFNIADASEVIDVLKAPDDEDGYDADSTEASRLVESLYNALSDGSAEEIADFVYNQCKWRL